MKIHHYILIAIVIVVVGFIVFRKSIKPVTPQLSTPKFGEPAIISFANRGSIPSVDNYEYKFVSKVDATFDFGLINGSVDVHIGDVLSGKIISKDGVQGINVNKPISLFAGGFIDRIFFMPLTSLTLVN